MTQNQQLARAQQQAPAPRDVRSNFAAVQESIERLDDYWQRVTSIVKLDPNPGAGDVYEASFLGANRVALSKNSLRKLLDLRGGEVRPELCYQEKVEVPEGYDFFYVAIIRIYDNEGKPKDIPGRVRLVDLTPGSDDYEELKAETSGYYSKQKNQFVKYSPEEAETKFRKRRTQVRQFRGACTLSKAINAAIRAGLQIKPSYGLDDHEMLHGFMVQRREYRPDTSIPAIAAAVHETGKLATRQLFGVHPQQLALPAPPASTPEAVLREELPDGSWSEEDLPVEEIAYDPETGEVFEGGQTQDDEPQVDVADAQVFECLEAMAQANSLKNLQQIFEGAWRIAGITDEHKGRLTEAKDEAKARLQAAKS